MQFLQEKLALRRRCNFSTKKVTPRSPVQASLCALFQHSGWPTIIVAAVPGQVTAALLPSFCGGPILRFMC